MNDELIKINLWIYIIRCTGILDPDTGGRQIRLYSDRGDTYPNVAWRNVEGYIELENSNMLEIGSIARANQEELAQMIRPTRYYNIKAKKLQAFCRHVIDNYDGSLELLFKRSSGP